MSLFWPLGRPWKRERKRDINGRSWWKCVEENGILELLEFWKMEFLWIVEEGREIRKKEKGKELIKRRYSL